MTLRDEILSLLWQPISFPLLPICFHLESLYDQIDSHLARSLSSPLQRKPLRLCFGHRTNDGEERRIGRRTDGRTKEIVSGVERAFLFDCRRLIARTLVRAVAWGGKNRDCYTSVQNSQVGLLLDKDLILQRLEI